MANKTSFVFLSIVSFWLIALGFGVMVIGLSGALAPEPMEGFMRKLMWVLAICGPIMIYGGVNMFIAGKKKVKDIEKDERELAEAVQKPVNFEEAKKQVIEAGQKAFPDKNTLLAHWTYNAAEWKEYTKKEFKYRIREALLLWLLITGLGTWLLGGYREMGHLASFITSLVTGGIFTIIRFIIAYNARNANSLHHGDILISAKSILINGKYHTLNDENITMTKIELQNDEKSVILEFTVEWNTRKGRTNEQIRVPVPEGKIEEALKLKDLFYNEVMGKY